jgi:hypothetical protein
VPEAPGPSARLCAAVRSRGWLCFPQQHLRLALHTKKRGAECALRRAVRVLPVAPD